MANAFLATKLSFVNQIAGFCSHAKANVRDVLSGLALDPRIGSEFLQPGPGWGGSCFPKDTKAVAAVGRSIGYPMTLVEEAFRSNTEHMENMVALIATHAKRISSETIRIGFLGLSFKADTDDVRESPAVFICRELVRLGFEIKIYDPLAADVPDLINFRVTQLELALQDSEILVIGTEWSHFQALTPETCRNYMKGRTIIDLRFILDANLFAGSEFMVVRYGSNSTYMKLLSPRSTL